MKMRRPLLIMLLLMGLGAVAHAASAVDVSILPVFIGTANTSIETYRADLTNRSNQTQVGAFTVETSGTAYPFSVAAYGKTSIFLYHLFTYYGGWMWSMRCTPAGGGPVSTASG